MQLAINLAAVANSVDAYHANLISDFINHAVITDADAANRVCFQPACGTPMGADWLGA